MKRIRRLLYPKSPNGFWAPLLAAVILVATALVTFAACRLQPSRQSSVATQRQMTCPEASPYDRWLNQEVVYIIDDMERAAFQKLTSDEEREMFIKRFWERRNPTPGSLRNKFKEEHYRRIAHANEHFATSEPGWMTDRGHMYMVYGPPDEIEDHPKSDHSTYGREVWIYHHVEGIGDNVFVTFVDRAGTGEYRLAPGNAR